MTTFSYTDDFGDGSSPGTGSVGSNGATYALPTQVTSPPPNPGEPQQTAHSQYDFSTGLLTGFKDRNGVITQTIYNDPFDRPTEVKSALGVSGVESHTAMYYAQASPTTVDGVTLTNDDMLTAKDQNALDDGNLRSWTHTDGFGRTIESWKHDPQGDTKVSTIYDAMGRTSQTSNPYRPSQGETALYTTTGYDLAGRVISVTTPDSAVVNTAYSGNQVLVTDQAGKQRMSQTNALGQLTDVWEITAADPSTVAVSFPGHTEVTAGYHTSYGYTDTLDDLTSVTQVSAQATQTRSFSYDSLKRLISATNPENGTISYQYDDNGNLTQKVDPRLLPNSSTHLTSTIAYDALNRVTSKSYNDGTPTATYYYDGQTLPSGAPTFTHGYATGRLVGITYGSSTSATGTYQGYDAEGRINQSYQVTNDGQTNQTYSMPSYGYDLAGELTSEQYPSGRVISTSYDGAGRVSGVTGEKGTTSTTYASQISYTSHEAIASMQLGNNLWEHTTFNTRLQTTQIGLGTSSTDSSTLQLGYSYIPVINGTPDATKNNGNLQSQTITAPGLNVTQNYGYDSLNRLLSAQEMNGTAQNWQQTWTYDSYGNRSVDTIHTTPSYVGANPQINPATNRITPRTGEHYDYDAAGNLTHDASGYSYTYDAENKQTSYQGGNPATGGSSYSYDGDGRRVKTVTPAGTTIFVYDADGQMVAEYSTAVQSGSGGTSYLTADTLGSPRVITASNGTVKARHDYLPFGEEIGRNISGYVVDNVRQKFTGKERDIETGLDYFEARYYASAQGRFTSPDEFAGGPHELFADVLPSTPTFYAELTEPASLNKYAYCLNNPLRYIDPDGHQTTESDVLALSQNPLVINGLIGVGKSIANVAIGAANAGAEALGHPKHEYFKPDDDEQAAVMNTTDKVLIIGSLLGGKGPANVVTADAEETAVVTGETVGSLRAAGRGDAHHIIQDAAVRDIPNYDTDAAPGVALAGPANRRGTPHNAATRVQHERGGGTYAAERRIGYKALRRAGISREEARGHIQRADDHFRQLGVNGDTPTRHPGNRRRRQNQ